MNEITQTAIQQADLQETLQSLADRLGDLFLADGCFITLWDEDEQKAYPGAAYGDFKEFYITDKNIIPRPGEPTMTQAVLSAEKVLVIENVHDLDHISRRISAQFPTQSSMVLPLIANEVKLGAAIISYNQDHKFSEDEIDLGEKAAQQLALAILKTRLLEDAQVRATEAETLRKASSAVVATLKRDEAHQEGVGRTKSGCTL